MIEIMGPTYKFQGEKLTKPEIIYVNDHQYNEEDQCFHLKKLLDNSECDPREHLVVLDHIQHDEEFLNYQILCMPVFMASETQMFVDQKIQPNWHNKTATFNFMINKPRIHREFLLLLLDHFELTNYVYSLPWKNVVVNQGLLKKYNFNDFYNTIIDSANLKVKEITYKFGSERQLGQGILSGSISNNQNYDQLLKTSVFEPSCVSLITEPAFFERETIHSEKTLMAMYGGTLPIWVGGWKLASGMKKMGFDVFDDLVDHSYESLADPYDRCYFALEKNLHLLKDFETTCKITAGLHDRFEKNIRLLETNPFLTDCINKIEQYPEPIMKQLAGLLKEYRQPLFQHVRFRNLPDYQRFGSLNTKSDI